MMTTHREPLSVNHATAKARRGAVALLVTTLYLQGAISQATETAKSPAMPAAAPPPAGQYHLDKSRASLVLRVNHLGFSTYTTRFSHFDSELTFDPIGDLVEFAIEAEFNGLPLPASGNAAH